MYKNTNNNDSANVYRVSRKFCNKIVIVFSYAKNHCSSNKRDEIQNLTVNMILNVIIFALYNMGKTDFIILLNLRWVTAHFFKPLLGIITSIFFNSSKRYTYVPHIE